MDYEDYVVPFLSGSSIKDRAESFRKEYWDDSLTVEVEDIIELRLELNIIPVPQLMERCDVDALITSNWKFVYIDNGKFSDERYKNRLRFSLAHEIGHFILHKDVYKSFGIKSLEDFYRLMKNIQQEQYGYLETQANKFASHLLIPRNELIIEKNKFIDKLKKQDSTMANMISSNKIDSKTLNSYIAIPISKKFGVSDDAMEIALNDIDLTKIKENKI